MDDGTEYFHLECHCLDSDGKAFGEATVEPGILKFRGTKRIDSLGVFPLEYHPNIIEVQAHLVECGRKFVSLMGVHHRQYRGDAFYMHKGKPIEVPVNGQIMIDAIFFHEANPNYSRPRISESGKYESTGLAGMFFSSDDDSAKRSNQIKSNGKDPAEIKEDELILCNPTVPGFSYGNKIAVAPDLSACPQVERHPSPGRSRGVSRATLRTRSPTQCPRLRVLAGARIFPGDHFSHDQPG